MKKWIGLFSLLLFLLASCMTTSQQNLGGNRYQISMNHSWAFTRSAQEKLYYEAALIARQNNFTGFIVTDFSPIRSTFYYQGTGGERVGSVMRFHLTNEAEGINAQQIIRQYQANR